MDTDFIRRATRVVSFNLTAADFQTTKYKEEIQSLYYQHMFPSFNPSMALTNLTKTDYNKLIRLLKSDDKEQYNKLHSLPIKGVGPGEAAIFLLTKEGVIAGGSSAGTDIIIGPKKYEVKAVEWQSTVTRTHVMNFKLGGSIPGMAQFEAELQRAFFDLKYTASRGEPNIPGSVFKRFERENNQLYRSYEKKYQTLAMQYFSNHPIIFIQNKENQPDYGEIISIQYVLPENIKMERYTSRTIKPIIKIN